MSVLAPRRAFLRGQEATADRNDSPFALERQSDHEVVIPAQDGRQARAVVDVEVVLVRVGAEHQRGLFRRPTYPAADIYSQRSLVMSLQRSMTVPQPRARPERVQASPSLSASLPVAA